MRCFYASISLKFLKRRFSNMLKIAVFDSGWGGELCADFLEEELPVAQIIRLIDWRNFPYTGKSENEIISLTERAISRCINKVDIIVLASNISTLCALDYLKDKYPNQKFIGVPSILERAYIRNHEKSLVLSTTAIFCHPYYRKSTNSRRQNNNYTLVSCDNWLKPIENGDFNKKLIIDKIQSIDNFSIVMLECTHLIELRWLFEKIYDWRIRVFDARNLILDEVCLALKIKGGMGKRLPSIFRK